MKCVCAIKADCFAERRFPPPNPPKLLKTMLLLGMTNSVATFLRGIPLMQPLCNCFASQQRVLPSPELPCDGLVPLEWQWCFFFFFVSLITFKLMHAGTRLHQIKGHL
jgi:hypothetical protein